MIKFRQKGNFDVSIKYLKKIEDVSKIDDKTFKRYGDAGVSALLSATPKDTGLTSRSWMYKIKRWGNQYGSHVSIEFYNTNENNGVNIAVILQYGHHAKNGAWVEGIDYINPALRPIFEGIANDVWKEVTKV